MTKERLGIGQRGEAAAAEYLQKRGWRVVARNYRTPLGELDLVAERRGILAFVEVKTRTSDLFGEGYEAVTARKREKLYRLAEYYLMDRRGSHLTVRFDVVSVRMDAASGTVEKLEHWEDAF